MKFSVKGNVEITKALYNYVEEKIFNKMSRFSNYIDSITVRLNVNNKNIHEVEVLTLFKNQGNSRVNKTTAYAENMYDAINKVEPKVLRQARKFKTAKLQRDTTSDNKFKIPLLYEGEDEEYEIVKIKSFNMKPMFVEEAIDQMNILGHDFFIYLDASIDKVCAVYRRKDGKYAIIETNVDNGN